MNKPTEAYNFAVFVDAVRKIMFINEVIMGGGVVLECIVLKGVSNLLPPLMYINIGNASQYNAV